MPSLEFVHYRPRPFKALLLLIIGFGFGGYVLPDYFVARHQYYARINCIQQHQPPIPTLPTGRMN
jgi:hypothetical protein